MKKMTGPVLLAGCLLFLAGCNTLAGQPGLQGAAITPDTLTPGEGAVVTMDIRDRQGIIERVQGVVVEDPSPAQFFNHPRNPRTRAFLEKIL